MNERDLDEFINDPGDLFVRQCEDLWHEMWEISNDGEQSMTLRKFAEAVARYLEIPGIYDKASPAERDAINPILMAVWTVISQPLEDYSESASGPLPPAVDRIARCARDLIDAIEGGLTIEGHMTVALSLKVCGNMAWQLRKPPERRQPTLR